MKSVRTKGIRSASGKRRRNPGKYAGVKGYATADYYQAAKRHRELIALTRTSSGTGKQYNEWVREQKKLETKFPKLTGVFWAGKQGEFPKKNPSAYVIAMYHAKLPRLTYDANSGRFTDNSKPSLYATRQAAEDRLALLKKNYGHMPAIHDTRVEPATAKERGNVYGARVRQRNPSRGGLPKHWRKPRVKKGIFYFKTNWDADTFAHHAGIPERYSEWRIVPYELGHAIQLKPSGAYAGVNWPGLENIPGGSTRPKT